MDSSVPTIELTLQRKTDSGYPVVAALTRPGGFLPLRREGTLTLDLAALAELQFEPLAYGTALGQALFVDEIRDTFVKALGDEPLRVLLSVEAPDLRALDWHRLAAPFDGRWRFLASQQNTPFSLAVPSPASAHFPAIGRRDLRALVLVAGPESLSGDYKLAPFDVAATLASIQAALGDIPCDILDHPTLDALCAALTRGVEPVETATPYTLLHLVCHSAVNQNGETILYLPKDEKRGPTPASDLLNRLSSLARLPHFVFLSACESALPQNGLGSLAGRLVRELGLPAVLAMTDRVSIATAGAIAAPFYAKLYEHGQPDLALAQSLAGLQGAHDLTVPAIFSRLGDRPLFDDNSERALTEKELEFGLAKLAESLPERAPVMDSLRDSLTRRLRSTLGADVHSLSESRRTERAETLSALNSLSLEALGLSFNALCLGQTPPAYDSRSPFRGLESFRPEDAAYFFGRETLTRKLVQKLNEHNFLAVLGASGSGKSSLVMAGLIPALNLPYAIFRPGAEPLAELEKALLPSPVGRGAGDEGDPQLLVVDQFEELFTLSAREQRADFISRLLEQSGRIRVVITLRVDFLGEVASSHQLNDEVQKHLENIPPMDETELRRAMEGQAGCAGLRFESDLSQQMLDDVSGEPGAMPLLQHALWTLWTRRHGRWLRAEEYRAFGGVKQAIASTAEAVYARCTEFEREHLRDIFLRLTRLDESADRRDTRRRVLLRDLIPADSDPAATTLLIKQLADARLLVVTGNEVEVAHEALIRHWERLRAWLNYDRDNLRLREGVSDDARRWENAARDESLLNHRGPRLELALAMSKNPRYRLNPGEQAYLDGCVRLREREIKAKETWRHRIMIGLATGLAIALVLAGFALYQMWQVEEQSKIAFARQLSSQSQNLNLDDGSTAIQSGLLAIEAGKRGAGWMADQALRRFLEYVALPTASMKSGGDVSSAVFSPDSKHVVSGGEDGTVRIWEISTDEEIARMLHENAVKSIAFSPDGKYIVSGDSDGIAWVWEASTGQKVARMIHNGSVDSVAFSPDGKYILSKGANTIYVWEAKTGREVIQKAYGTTIGVISATFSPDGRYIAAISSDGIVLLLEIATNKETAHMSTGSYVWAVAFSPDGKYLVSGSSDGTICVWDTATRKKVISVFHGYNPNSVIFSPDGKYFVSAGGNKLVRVWETETGKEITQMTHAGDVSSIAFSPDGKYIVSGSYDGTARVWEVTTGREVARTIYGISVYFVMFSPDGKWVLSNGCDKTDLYMQCSHRTARVWKAKADQDIASVMHDDTVYSALFSPDAKYAMSMSQDQTARIWETSTGKEITRVTHNGALFSIDFSPNGKWAVSSGCDDINNGNCLKGSARVLEVETGKEVIRMTHDNLVSSVAFSLDSKYLVTGSYDQTARIWEVITGKELARMTHHTPVYQVAISPDGKYVASASRDKAAVWEAKTGKEVSSVTYNDTAVSSVAFSPDGKYVMLESRDKTVILELVAGKEVARAIHDGANSAAFSPDGRYIVSGGDGTVTVWETKSGRIFARMSHDSVVTSVAFSPDSKYIVSGSYDRTVRVWEVATSREVARMSHDDLVESVKFSPDGHYIVSSSDDRTARVWYWQIEDLISEVCKRLPRNLTITEWARYIGDEPYRATCPDLPLEPETTATPTP